MRHDEKPDIRSSGWNRKTVVSLAYQEIPSSLWAFPAWTLWQPPQLFTFIFSITLFVTSLLFHHSIHISCIIILYICMHTHIYIYLFFLPPLFHSLHLFFLSFYYDHYFLCFINSTFSFELPFYIPLLTDAQASIIQEEKF